MSELTDKYANPEYYQNRELSWLQFDRRCLSEARNKDNPLFERLKFKYLQPNIIGGQAGRT